MDFPFPVSPEDAQALETILETLAWLKEADDRPFPYADIRHIYKTVTSRKIRTRRAIDKGFGPDLNTYQMEISSVSRWGVKIFQWPSAERKKGAYWLGQPFFERWPQYLLVRRWIREVNTSDLYRDFVLYEEMRLNALALIGLLDKLQNPLEKP